MVYTNFNRYLKWTENFTINDVAQADVEYDVNKNGTLDAYTRAIYSQETNPEIFALLEDPRIGPEKVAYCHFYCDHWVMTRTASSGDRIVDLENTEGLDVGTVYRIGKGNNFEFIKITSKSSYGADFIRQEQDAFGEFKDAYPIYLQYDHETVVPQTA